MTTYPDTATERYTAEMIAACSAWMNGDQAPMIAHAKKWNCHFPPEDNMRQVIVCKCVTGNTRFPMEMRTRAKQWLLANWWQPWGDGDIPT